MSSDCSSGSSSLDPRSLGIGVIIGVLSTLILGAVIILLSSIRRPFILKPTSVVSPYHSTRHLLTTSSQSYSQSRMSFGIDDPITFPPRSRSPPSSHNSHFYSTKPTYVWDSDVVLDISPLPSTSTAPQAPMKIESQSQPSSSALRPLTERQRESIRTAHRLPSGIWTFSNDPPRKGDEPSLSASGSNAPSELPRIRTRTKSVDETTDAPTQSRTHRPRSRSRTSAPAAAPDPSSTPTPNPTTLETTNTTPSHRRTNSTHKPSRSSNNNPSRHRHLASEVDMRNSPPPPYAGALSGVGSAESAV